MPKVFLVLVPTYWRHVRQ